MSFLGAAYLIALVQRLSGTWLASKSQRSVWFWLSSARVKEHTSVFSFQSGFRGSNSSPHVYKASSLLTGLSPQPTSKFVHDFIEMKCGKCLYSLLTPEKSKLLGSPYTLVGFS